MADRKILTKENKKLLEDHLEIWRTLDHIVRIQEKTVNIIEKILDLPKAILKGLILGFILGTIATVGFKLWSQATPDGRLNSYTVLLVFFAGVIVKGLLDKIRKGE